jgi:hypothetical protein
MHWSDISFKPPTRTLWQFAGLWILFLGGLACWQGFVRGNTVSAVVLAALALTVGPVGLIRPQAIRFIYVGAMLITFPIGWLVSRLVLTIIFYGVFTPMALLFNLLGRDALGLKRQPDAPSYWTPKTRAAGPKSYLRQF